MENDVVVVVVPFVAQGHLNQLLHLSRLLAAYNLPVHIAGTTTHNRQAKLRIHGWNHNSNTNIHFHEFKTPEFESPPPNPNSSTKFPSHLIPSFKASSHLREPFAKLLATVSNTARRVVVIHDYLMSTAVQDVVSFPNVEAYVFHCASAFTTFSYMWEEKGRPCLDDVETYIPLTKIPILQDLIPPDFMEFIYSHVNCHEFNSGNIHDTCKVFEGDIFKGESRNIELPKGFEERIEGKGLVIGVNVGDWGLCGEVVTSSVIEETIRKLMDSDEGNEMRKRAKKIGENVRQSVEEGGVTSLEINAFVDHITRQ
ncbi:hypothetical protein L1987_82307 [Smallanthus sonchifolius]|uniref:Uncharacterized protein n=1 Tax=Smallanthus sonchifolius TaxID=185202 RepID=A0ACB8YBE6_9ASTR|nr:hypothetical protein L1987_82307 [Smallanthus sonchifolius]